MKSKVFPAKSQMIRIIPAWNHRSFKICPPLKIIPTKIFQKKLRLKNQDHNLI